MARVPILTEKFHRPDAAGLARPRLEEPLWDSRWRLGLVVAPPGSGKTTLLARVAADAPCPVAWYRMTAGDTTETALVAHLSLALGAAVGADEQDLTMEALLRSVQERSGDPVAVVLDDVHEISGTTAERALEQFVALRPQAVRVLMGSRREPGINIPRLRVSGTVHEVGSDDLRFRFWEVEELFAGIYREPLSPEAAAALTRRTGGWAAGLQLFHLATAGRSALERHRAVTDLGGRSKLVRSYLAANVLAELPGDRREFLLRTCTLEYLSGSLCDELLDTEGSATILDDLEQRQLFTSSDDDGATYRYHEVLRAHLEWALEQEFGGAAARAWYAKSAVLMESTGDRRGAVRAYSKAEDWAAVARLIRSGSDGADAAGADLMLPQGLVEHDAWLSLARGRRLLRDGVLAGAAEAFRTAEGLLDDAEFRDDCRRDRLLVLEWSGGQAAGPAGRSDDVGGPRHWSADLRAATRRVLPEQVHDAPSVRDAPAAERADGSGALLSRGLIALLLGDLRAAGRALEAVHLAVDADPCHRVLARLATVVIHLLTGGGPDPQSSLSRIGSDAEEVGLPWAARMARGLLEAVLVARGSAPWRMTACADHWRESEHIGDDWGAAGLKLAATLAAQIANEKPDPADFADVARRFRDLDAPVLAVWSETLHACFQVRAGMSTAAQLATEVAAAARTLDLAAADALATEVANLACTRHDQPARPTVVAAADRSGLAASLLGLITGSPAGSPRMSKPSASSGPAAVMSVPRRVQIRCFGGFAMQVDGVEVDLRPLRPKARALLRLLALTPDRDVHRECLVDSLWPDVELSVGIRRLQVAVSSARQLLEDNGLTGAYALARRADAYRLSLPAGSSVDIRSFEEALREAAICATRGDIPGSSAARERALALYIGDLLPEDGPAEYVTGSREHFRLAAGSASAALAQDHRALGRLPAAVEAARVSLRLNRYQDLAWRLLIDLHQAAGDSCAAARTRSEYTRIHDELEAADAAPVGSYPLHSYSPGRTDREAWSNATVSRTG